MDTLEPFTKKQSKTKQNGLEVNEVNLLLAPPPPPRPAPAPPSILCRLKYNNFPIYSSNYRSWTGSSDIIIIRDRMDWSGRVLRFELRPWSRGTSGWTGDENKGFLNIKLEKSRIFVEDTPYCLCHQWGTTLLPDFNFGTLFLRQICKGWGQTPGWSPCF